MFQICGSILHRSDINVIPNDIVLQSSRQHIPFVDCRCSIAASIPYHHGSDYDRRFHPHDLFMLSPTRRVSFYSQGNMRCINAIQSVLFQSKMRLILLLLPVFSFTKEQVNFSDDHFDALLGRQSFVAGKGENNTAEVESANNFDSLERSSRRRYRIVLAVQPTGCALKEFAPLFYFVPKSMDL